MGTRDPQLHERLAEATRVVRARVGDLRPRVGLILGSGLGAFAEGLAGAVSCDYGEIPWLRPSSVPGHAGRLVCGAIAGVPVAVLSGRIHLYEGHSPADCAFPARVLAGLGVRAVIVTNSSGGIRADLEPGDLMIIEDHINFSGSNPLAGPHDERVGPRFPDMTEAYAPRLRALCARVGEDLGLALKRGVYAILGGPSYETPAEVRAMRTLGVDAVGMSTVYEVVAARQMGVEVLGISCISNRAAGTGRGKLDHQEVLEVGLRVRATFVRLLEALVPRMAESVWPS